jgi:heme oxygenase (biliverdin-IX-beta and delta-forming)
MIMMKLKEATKPQHDSLEEAVDIINTSSTLAGYINLLKGFYSYHASIEKSLAAVDWEKLNFDYDSRRKKHLLARDLQVLGVNPDELESWEDLPAISDAPQAVGSLYVLEGSTLGGQIISRHLAKSLALNPDNGAAFFNSYGERVGEMWKSFCLFATNYAQTTQKDKEIIETACQTFSSFERCLKQQLN